MDIQIANRQKRLKIPIKRLRRTAQLALVALGYPEAELSVSLVDDARIAEMNRRWLERKGPTNVIAFPMQEGEFAGLSPNLLGDVVISADTAQREALRAAVAFETRLSELLVHGILHLCGYDHEQGPREARRMSAQARRLMRIVLKRPEAQNINPRR